MDTNKKSKLQVDFAKQQSYLGWLKNYFKYYLLSNYSNDEFREYYRKKTNKEFNENRKLLEFIEQVTITEIIIDLKKYINYDKRIF